MPFYFTCYFADSYYLILIKKKLNFTIYHRISVYEYTLAAAALVLSCALSLSSTLVYDRIFMERSQIESLYEDLHD